MQMEKAKSWKKIIAGVIVLGVVVVAVLFWKNGMHFWTKKDAISSNKKAAVMGDQRAAEGINIKVTSPNVNGTVTSPLKVSGEAKGWYADGSFPVKLLDDKGAVLATGIAQAKGDWKADAFVPFELEMKFDAKGAKNGDIIFEKSNPSGKPESAGSFSFAVLLGE